MNALLAGWPWGWLAGCQALSSLQQLKERTDGKGSTWQQNNSHRPRPLLIEQREGWGGWGLDTRYIPKMDRYRTYQRTVSRQRINLEPAAAAHDESDNKQQQQPHSREFVRWTLSSPTTRSDAFNFNGGRMGPRRRDMCGLDGWMWRKLLLVNGDWSHWRRTSKLSKLSAAVKWMDKVISSSTGWWEQEPQEWLLFEIFLANWLRC